jgi:hypothetical protein
MDAIAWLTALYIALWVGVYGDNIKKDMSSPTEQTQQVEQKK